MRLRLFATLACLGLCLGTGSAGATALRFEQLDTRSGLPQETVHALLQDSKGFVWLGTQGGLARYDGQRVVAFRNDPDKAESLGDNLVQSLLEDPTGRLWIGTRQGISRLDPVSGRFVRFASAGLPGQAQGLGSIVALVPSGSSGAWVGSDTGLYRLDFSSGNIVPQPLPGMAAGERVPITALTRAPDDDLWLATPGALLRFSSVDGSITPFPLPGAPGNEVRALIVATDGTLWLGGPRGLEAWHIEGEQVRRRAIGAREGLASVRIRTLLEDRSGRIWVGTEDAGLFYGPPGEGRFVALRHERADPHSLADNRVVSLMLDNTGSLWAGTWHGGASRVDLESRGFERHVLFPLGDGTLADSHVRAVADAGDGQVWLGTAGNGLLRFDLEARTTERVALGRGKDTVLALARDADTRLWVGLSDGLVRRDPTGALHHFDLGPAPPRILAIAPQPDGVTWLATSRGLGRLDTRTGKLAWHRREGGNALAMADHAVFSILVDSARHVWIGTESGLDRLDPGGTLVARFRHVDGDSRTIPSDRVHAVFEDHEGRVWVGTAGGLCLAGTGSGSSDCRHIALGGVSESESVGAIEQDVIGRIWASTSGGLSLINPVSMTAHRYTGRDGIIDGSFFVGASARLDNGTLAFGGAQGLTTFQPDAIRYNPHPPRVAITEVRVFDQPLPPLAMARLAYNQNSLAFEFAALHYSDPARNRYAYRLDGFDDDWVTAGAGRPFATYTNLPPGHYEFQVRAASKDGIWSSDVARFALTIVPPFWMTAGFRIAAGMLMLLLAYAGYRLRVRSLIARQLELSAQVAARTEQLRAEKAQVEEQKEVIETAHGNIARISEIGRRLTTQLSDESLMAMLHDDVRTLMDAELFGVGVMHDDQGVIAFPFVIERGKRYERYERDLGDPRQPAVWCVTNQQEIFVNDVAAEGERWAGMHGGVFPALEDGSVPFTVQSMLYVPVTTTAGRHGLVCVQSSRKDAYSSIDLDMLRTLAAYLAVAMDNANAYRQLDETRDQLVAQEKMASLGALVAGIAHELNTPIGNGIVSTTTVEGLTVAMRANLASGALKRSEFERYLADVESATRLTLRGLTRAADLVAGFKQLAADSDSAPCERFDLLEATQGAVAALQSVVTSSGHVLEIDVPAGITLVSYKGPYGDVITNFLSNSLTHAFTTPGGTMRIAARPLPGERIEVSFSDDGAGIEEGNLKRIFDPFFTTHLGQGRSGLGLNIAYNIVTSVLKGTISVHSAPGQGTCFTLILPRCAGETVPHTAPPGN